MRAAHSTKLRNFARGQGLALTWALTIPMLIACGGDDPSLEVHAVWTDARSPLLVTHNGQVVEPDGFGVYSVRQSFQDFAHGASEGVRVEVRLATDVEVETILPVGSCLWNCAEACTLTDILAEDFVAAVGADGLVSVERASCRNEAGESEGWIASILGEP